MKKEYQSLCDNETWTLTDLPHGAHLLKGKWVWDVKRDGQGQITKYKARWVAKGFTQVEGIDYEETFAPASHLGSLRMLLSIAAINDWEIHQLDVKSAFLNGIIDKDIYIEQPHEFIDINNPTKVCKLKKSLYGLKQSPRLWNNQIRDILLKYGFTQLLSDPSIYVKHDTKDTIILGLHVDDMVVTSTSNQALNLLEKYLESNVQLTVDKAPSWFLGMTIRRDRTERKIYLGQEQYVSDTLEEFGLSKCNTSPNPMIHGSKNLYYGPWASVDPTTYQMAIGKLLYLARCTRPDIASSVGILGQFATHPLFNHWTAVEQLFKYVKGTKDLELCLTGSKLEIKAYSDSDWAGDLKDRKSRSGCLVYLGDSPILWSSQKQEVVAKSTTEAEYIALSSASSEVIWTRSILKELGILNEGDLNSTTIYEDNKGCQLLANNPQLHPKTKHIDIRHHFINDHIMKKDIVVYECPTANMVADILTKPLPTVKMKWCRTQLQLQ